MPSISKQPEKDVLQDVAEANEFAQQQISDLQQEVINLGEENIILTKKLAILEKLFFQSSGDEDATTEA